MVGDVVADVFEGGVAAALLPECLEESAVEIEVG
jgi:hypothetical protein